MITRVVKAAHVPGLRRVLQARSHVDPQSVLFESWHGQYSDNPRAISEALWRRRPDYRQIWIVEDHLEDLPEYAELVSPHTARYLRVLGEAGCLVTANSLPGYFLKKEAAVYLQTWHGTPLKRIGFDMTARALHQHRAYLREFARDVSKWDYLISPNRFSTDVLRRAFRFSGRVLETGYPRNDRLKSDARDEIREATRDRLGIDPDSRALLYAPTLRDGARFELRLDLEEMLNQLTAPHVVLLRRHHIDRADGTPMTPGTLDVSHISDIRDLYLAADVLITDYSSAMFDFAVTGKPILFFTYDLAEYRDQLRGFYFDFEREAPGPILQSTREVIDALNALAEVTSQYEGAYARFTDRFCHLDDGQASQRVIDSVFDLA